VDFEAVGMGIVGWAFLLRLSLDFLAGAELTAGAGPDAVLEGCCRTWRLMSWEEVEWELGSKTAEEKKESERKKSKVKAFCLIFSIYLQCVRKLDTDGQSDPSIHCDGSIGGS
jgi:hypothetical protein